MTTIIIVAAILGFVLVAFAGLAYKSRTGSAPGLENGRLMPCAKRPNCVSSEHPDDHAHFIPPLNFPKDGSDNARAIVRSIISEIGGDVIVEEKNYLAATFKSPVFGFVDDLEVRFDDTLPLIHLRSASRIGYSDRGVNRKRVKALRNAFSARTADAG